MNKNLILTVGFVLSFSFSAFANSEEQVLLAYNCANSVFNYSDSIRYSDSCVTLYKANPERSVLKTLKMALAKSDIPDGLTIVDLEETIRYVESIEVISSNVNWKN